MKPTNVLVIMSDQHNRKMMGVSGHSVVKTPNLDRLAERGTRFTDAYCNSAICVPSRASFATGQYVHNIGYWDNADPYDGKVPSWGHRLLDAGHYTASIGKLHYRSAEDAAGFEDEILPLHVVDGIGDLLGLIRDELPLRAKNRGYIEEARGGESTYTKYDRNIAEHTVRWLKEEAPKHKDKPWVLFSSLVCPHPPMIAPEDFYGMYPADDVLLPAQHTPADWPMHPSIAAQRKAMRMDTPFPEAVLRNAIATYYALTSYLDHNVGKILDALEAAGLAETTRVIYTSDHGENAGAHGLWGKTVMYEDSVGVPLIMAGPDIPAGKVAQTPVTLVDVYPTVLEAAGLQRKDEEQELPGRNLVEIAANGQERGRRVFAEYHASGSITGTYMVRNGAYKYVHYVGLDPQLFDVVADPHETKDLAQDPSKAALLKECEGILRDFCDPEAVNQKAKDNQAEKIARYGGKEAILKKGSFGYTPAPGETPVYKSL